MGRAPAQSLCRNVARSSAQILERLFGRERLFEKETRVNLNRRRFFAGSLTMAAATGAASAQGGIPGGTHQVERIVDFDASGFAAIVGRPAQIRQLYEAFSFQPAVLKSIKNSFNGLQFGFGYPAGSASIVLAGHGASAAYGYSDFVWQRYHIGEFLKIDDAAGRPILRNIYLRARARYDVAADPDDDAGMYQDASIEMLQRRGLVMLTCHTAVEEQAHALVRDGFAPSAMTAQDVANDILTHLIAGSVVVPSMVATIAVLQARYRYSYLTPA